MPAKLFATLRTSFCAEFQCLVPTCLVLTLSTYVQVLSRLLVMEHKRRSCPPHHGNHNSIAFSTQDSTHNARDPITRIASAFGSIFNHAICASTHHSFAAG